VTAEQATTYEGLPAAEKVQAWEAVQQGAAQILLEEFRSARKHQRRLTWFREALSLLRIIFAFASVVLFVWLARYFVDQNAPTQGAALVGAGLAALVTAFLGQQIVAERGSRSSG
jgi:hypothetical protein